jgi:tRNA uridine 5-carbamoylmethylation protein Kti12
VIQPIYIVLVGLPGSGKSTFAEELLDCWSEDADYPATVSSDMMIEAYAANHNITYSEAFAIPTVVKNAINHAKITRGIALKNNLSIIHDQTNLSAAKRIKLLADVPDNYIKACVVFQCEEEERQRRMSQRIGKVIPAHVDNFMKSSYEAPSIEEGFNYVVGSPYYKNVLSPWMEL